VRSDRSYTPTPKPGLFSSIKKVFHKDSSNRGPVRNTTPARSGYSVSGGQGASSGGNTALKEVLNKTLSAKPVVAPAPPPISLDSLKETSQKPARNASSIAGAGGDRAASPEEMNKLKDLITKSASQPKADQPRAEIPVPPPSAAPAPAPTPVPPKPEPVPIPIKPAPAPASAQGSSEAKKVREVPEDVLRKILE
jgi:hypothetical protein